MPRLLKFLRRIADPISQFSEHMESGCSFAMHCPRQLLRRKLTLITIAVWCFLILSIEGCHSKGKEKHPIVARMLIRVSFVTVDVDETDDKTLHIDACADRAVYGYRSSLKTYFLSNTSLMKVLEDGEDENFLTMLRKLHRLWICDKFYTICKKFTWCIYCKHIPELRAVGLCR
ncbi:uncharacterized protein LOC120338068 [Styela clava]